MKPILLAFFMLFFIQVEAQDPLKMKLIDAQVMKINSSSLPIKLDTIIKEHPALSLKMTTYLSIVMNKKELIKYQNLVNTTTVENGTTKSINSANTFYYEHQKLIKVEEYLIEGQIKKTADWYYAEGQPLFFSAPTEKS